MGYIVFHTYNIPNIYIIYIFNSFVYIPTFIQVVFIRVELLHDIKGCVMCMIQKYMDDIYCSRFKKVMTQIYC